MKKENPFKNLFTKKGIFKTVLVLLAVIGMGAALSLLLSFDMGADPFTAMNKAISARIGLSFGTWQLIINCALFLLMLLLGRKYIGLGTLANMILVGYSCDFFTFLLQKMNVTSLAMDSFLHVLIFLLALLLFLGTAAVYMDVHLGVSPYDGLAFIFADAVHKIPVKFFQKIPFRVLRILYDASAVLIGLLCGAKLQLVTCLMAALLGPSVDGVGKLGTILYRKITRKKKEEAQDEKHDTAC